MSGQKRKYVHDMNAIVDFMTESDGEIVLGEDFEDTDDSDWEYDEEEGVAVPEEANHNTATDPDPATLPSHISEDTSESVPDDDDNFPLNLLCASNHNTDTVQSEENQNNIGDDVGRGRECRGRGRPGRGRGQERGRHVTYVRSVRRSHDFIHTNALRYIILKSILVLKRMLYYIDILPEDA